MATTGRSMKSRNVAKIALEVCPFCEMDDVGFCDELGQFIYVMCNRCEARGPWVRIGQDDLSRDEYIKAQVESASKWNEGVKAKRS